MPRRDTAGSIRRPARTTGVVAVGLLAVLVAGCPRGATGLESTGAVRKAPEAEKAFRRGRDLFERGLLEEADRELSAMAREFPRDPLARAASVLRARIAIARGDPEGALEVIGAMTFRDEADAVTREARLCQGVAMSDLGRCAQAVAVLEPLAGRLTDEADRRLLTRRLADCAARVGERGRAVVWLDANLALSPSSEERERALSEIERLCAEIGEARSLERLADELDVMGAAWPYVMAAQAGALANADETEAASAVIARVREERRDAAAVVDEIAESLEQRTRVDMSAVGCILPLSGRSRLVGEAVLRGVMLGARDQRLGKDGHALSVVLRDSEGDPAKAAAAVDSLVLQENVAAVVGAVDGAVAVAVAKRAERHGVPVVLLTMRERAQGSAARVFRNFLSVFAEIGALMDAAVRTGSGRFAVLARDDAWGRTMADAFKEESKRRNLPVAAVIFYAPSQTGFSKEAKQLAGLEFDALFVADPGPGLSLIAPGLAVEGLWSVPPGELAKDGARGIRLLVPSAAVRDDLPRRAGRYLQGALFASGFFEEGPAGATRFARRFESVHGKRPSFYAAFGHDAVVLVAGAVNDGARGREEIAKWLSLADAGVGERLGLAAPFSGFDAAREPKGAVFTLMLVGDTWELLP